MEVWRITKDGVLDECMIEWPPLTDGNVRWLWPMRKGMEKWLTVRGWQIHRFSDVRRWDGSRGEFNMFGRGVKWGWSPGGVALKTSSVRAA